MPAAAPRRPFERIVVIVCDSVGCGEAPDAADFGDAGANTLARVIGDVRPSLPHLAVLGLDRIPGVPSLGVDVAAPTAARGRMTEVSPAKDTMTGHWELMCLPSEEPFPVYPDGFPADVMERFEAAIGRPTLANRRASGTEIIRELGTEHLRSGAPIVYTSGDSVFQIAAHEEIIPPDELYGMCEAARRVLGDEHRVARIIARPFVGDAPESFRRTPRRRDFALPPPQPTALDLLLEAGIATLGVGKIHDIFAGRGLSDYVKTADNDDGVDRTIEALTGGAAELVFTNLVDFDSDYGHRRDVAGYAAALERFDARIPDLLGVLGADDLLILTADHGNDPGFPGTDHTRERVPLLVTSARTRPVDLGTRESFADLGATVLDNFGLRDPGAGTSFLLEIQG